MQFSPYYRITDGAESAVLMIHGIVGSPIHFRELIPLIPENWSIYNILLDGHGGQVEDFAHSSMEKWRSQVSSQLDTILQTHRNVLIVAHSMGTLFAIREAIRHPNRVKALFLLSVPLVPGITLRSQWNTTLAMLGLSKPGSLAMNMTNDSSVHLSPKIWKYLGWIPRFLELLVLMHRTKKLPPQLTVPTLAYHCAHDEMVSHRSCKYLENLPSVRLTHLPDSGHFVYGKDDLALLQRDLSRLIASL